MTAEIPPSSKIAPDKEIARRSLYGNLSWLSSFDLVERAIALRFADDETRETGPVMLNRSMLKAWIVCWFELANPWLPFFVGTAQQREVGQK